MLERGRGRASGAATRRRDGKEGGPRTRGDVEVGLRDGEESGARTRGGEEVGLHDGEEDITTGGGEEVGTT